MSAARITDGAATLAHMRRVGQNLTALDEQDRLAAARADGGDKIAAGLRLGAELAAHHTFPPDDEPEGQLLMRRWRSLNG